MPLKMVYTVENVKHLTIWNLFLLSLSEDYGNKQGSEVNDFFDGLRASI